MRIFNYKDVEPEGPLRWLIRGPHFDMRLVEVEPSPDIPSPQGHPWEHEIFIVEGRGVVWDGRERRPFREGDMIHILANEPHTFINLGKKPLRFVCCIPSGVDLKQITTATR